jgi:hypothetical protein
MVMLVREAPDQPYRADARDVDTIEALGEEVALGFARLDALTQRTLAALAEFDRRRGWELAGYPSAAHWLTARCRMSLVTARDRVRVARELAGLPLTQTAMARGQLSYCQVRTLTREATADTEEELLVLARGASVKELERMMRAWRKGTRVTEAERERRIHESRTLAIFPDDDGGYTLRGRLTAEDAALLMRGIEAAGDALFRAGGSAARTDAEKQREAAQRRADAIVLLAERALAAGFGPPADGTEAPISGTRADRYQVVLHVEPEALREPKLMAPDAGDAARSELMDGTRATRESSRRMACDATVLTVTQKPDGTVLDVGRRTRTIPPRLRLALEIRDRGCRFPGCDTRFTDGHHVRHWADGGEHSLGNITLLCRAHHRLVHEGGWMVRWDDQGRPMFFDTRGHAHYEGRWQPPVISEEELAGLGAGCEHVGVPPGSSAM